MTRYIEFENSDSSKTLVEIDDSESEALPGQSLKAGLVDQLSVTVSKAGATLQTALSDAIRANVTALDMAMKGLPDPPTEVEMAFSLKATGELSNIAIGKIGGEANYSLKLIWKDNSINKRS